MKCRNHLISTLHIAKENYVNTDYLIFIFVENFILGTCTLIIKNLHYI